MSLLINFKDAVNAAVLDPNATHAVFYMDGDFENEGAVRERCPHAKLYAITTRGATGHGIFALDSENGDIDTGARGVFPKTEAWVAEQVRLDVAPIAVYANQDRWLNLGLLARLEHYGDRIERWDADFDGNPTVPSWASAKQYLSGSVDLNVALANFFGDAQPKPPTVHWWSAEIQISVPVGSRGTAHFAGSIDLAKGDWKAHGTPGIVHWSGKGGGDWRVKSMPLNAPPLGK